MKEDILIIDDEESIRKMLSTMLKKQHYSVATAASGVEALTLLKTNSYQLILLDLKMPIMSGTETLREIRKIDRKVPVYIITAFESEYFKELEEIRKGGIGFELLRKPIAKDDFLMVVGNLLKKPPSK